MVYLDNAATTAVRPEVLEVIHDSLLNDYGNPSSTYRLGKKVKHSMIQARKQLAELLNVDESEVYFTSGATEANNWAIRSQAEKSKELGQGNHIVTTAIEHPSVTNVTKYLETQGFEVTYIQPNERGEITVQQFIDVTTDQTIGWIAMAVNNEVGSILPIFELGEEANERNLWFHVDSVQAVGPMAYDYSHLKCTTFVGSAHKFNGPKGIGFLIYRSFQEHNHLGPLLYGGGQENKMRSGTENVPYILGMVKALELTFAEQEETYSKYEKLHLYLIETLNERDIEFEINGDMNNRVPYINNLWFNGNIASQMLIKMDLDDVYISAGSACSAGSLTESDILKAYYPDQPERWSQSLRISFGYQTTREDIDQFIQSLKKISEGKIDLWLSKKLQN
ncbi:cysteine desulfurase [Ruoffia tabacinasalis]|uniref:Cysteine desulfurase n=1 Tax=Ruoffia tabacinasalis TaxID=87458 RepID=A0A5R9DX18_9LACT|nr:cysteine desulfurase family protein [Ruoffia tabacinasalis]TLQ41067.1 cysteine desulfurase [Ruoffia tabacinasalis]